MPRVARIAVVTVALHAFAARAFAQDAPPGYSPWEAPPPPGVVVELQADSDQVRILRVDGGRQRVVCAAPCGEALPREGTYQIAGDGVVPTAPFSLADNASTLRLQVRAGSEDQHTAGIALIAAGVATYLAGSVYFFYKSASMPLDTPGNPRTLDVSLALQGTGAAAALVGLILTLTARTSVVTSNGVTFSLAPARRGRSRVRLTLRGLEF
jgi:hypothetical protein